MKKILLPVFAVLISAFSGVAQAETRIIAIADYKGVGFGSTIEYGVLEDLSLMLSDEAKKQASFFEVEIPGVYAVPVEFSPQACADALSGTKTSIVLEVAEKFAQEVRNEVGDYCQSTSRLELCDFPREGVMALQVSLGLILNLADFCKPGKNTQFDAAEIVIEPRTRIGF